MGGSLELIALLLEAQATVDIKDSNGESPIYRAMWGSQGLSTDLGLERLLLGHTNRRLGSFSEIVNGFLLERVYSSDFPLFRRGSAERL